MEQKSRENWGTKLGFVLATAGSAIGLGNIWKFPYMTGMNGGGAFVIVYLLCILFCGFPLMLCELGIGRAAHLNPMAAFRKLEGEQRSQIAKWIGGIAIFLGVLFLFNRLYAFALCAIAFGFLFRRYGFAVAGALAVLTSLFILAYYSVVGGWILEYIRLSFTGKILAVNGVGNAGKTFGEFLNSYPRVIGFHIVFLLISCAMLWGGIKDGIERWSRVLMPLLFILLLVVIFRSVTLPGARAGLDFFLSPDFSKLTAQSVLIALGHSFFTLSLGMGITMTYGSYLKKTENLFSSGLWIIMLDTMAAILSGIAIFPAVFAMGFQPNAGPSLIFQVLPATFNKIPGGLSWLWAGLFFVMFAIAALTSMASILECSVTFLVDTFKMRRKTAILLNFVATALVGVLACVSVSDWTNLPHLHKVLAACFGENILPGNWFDTMDHLTSNWMIPLSSMLTAIFVGWVWGSRKAINELRIGAEPYADRNLFLWFCGLLDDTLQDPSATLQTLTPLTFWIFLTRFFSPVIILVIFLQNLGLLSFS
ncbi:MAG: sodium-dependent transporter [Victivallales bacterium]|nr:sodium-dependent transporter [Victivallales bacterium]